LFIVTGVGLYFYFESEKSKVTERRSTFPPFLALRAITNKKDQELLSKSIGKPSIGGPFNLTTQDFQSFTEKDLLGNWTLIYFGFTNCPDICPEELDKMGQAVEMVDAARKERVLPMFISVDPARDGVKEVKKYIMGESPLTSGYENDKFGDMTDVRLPPQDGWVDWGLRKCKESL